MTSKYLEVKTCLYLAVLFGLVAHLSANIIFGSGPVRRPPSPPPTRPPTPQPDGAGCRDPQGQSGECRPVSQCPELQKFVKARDVAYLKASLCPRSGGRLLLCCPETVTPSPPTPKPERFRSPSFCGITKFGPPGRIVGGEPVQALGDLPWVVALGYSKRQPKFQCGGAVINRKWIMTAAHCILNNGPDTVRMGDLNFEASFDNDFFNPPQEIAVDKSFKHPQFLSRRVRPNKGLFNDIALIKLKQPIKFSEIVKPICLPEPDDEALKTRQVMIAGWGLTEFGGEQPLDMLYGYINMSLPGECKRLYSQSQVRIDDSIHLCANGDDFKNLPADCTAADFDNPRCRGGVDACGGDSGGPMMSFKRISTEQFRVKTLGVVSFAIGCGDPLHPGVYTKVDHFLDWISDTIASN